MPRKTRINHFIENEPPAAGVDRYNAVSDAVCNTCGVKDAFTVTGPLGADVTVRLGCGHNVLWRVV